MALAKNKIKEGGFQFEISAVGNCGTFSHSKRMIILNALNEGWRVFQTSKGIIYKNKGLNQPENKYLELSEMEYYWS